MPAAGARGSSGGGGGRSCCSSSAILGLLIRGETLRISKKKLQHGAAATHGWFSLSKAAATHGWFSLSKYTDSVEKYFDDRRREDSRKVKPSTGL